MIRKIIFTEITDKHGKISKVISLDPTTNKIIKSSSAKIFDGHAELQEMLFEQFPQYLSTVPLDKAITLGISDYKSIPFVVSGKEEPPKSIAKTKKYFKFSPTNQLLFFDYDSQGTESDITPTQFINITSSIIPEFEHTAKVVNYSSSSFIFHQGKQINDGNGFHVYFIVEDTTDIKRFKDVLLKRLWLSGHGFIWNSVDGKQFVKTIFDTAVFSPERLDFVAGAICKDGLTQKKPAPEYFDGEVLDTTLLIDLNDDEQDEYDQLVKDAKLKNSPLADELAKKYDNKAIEKLVKEGVPKHKAKGVVQSRRSGVLADDDIVTFNDGTSVTVKELLNNGNLYDGRYLCDPIEPEAGQSKAHFYWNEGKCSTIKSFIHGERIFTFKSQETSSKNQRATSEGHAPTYPVDYPHSPEEGEQALHSIIRAFIDTGQHTCVLYEAGGGKTQKTIQLLAEEYKRRNHKFKLAYFVNNHKISGERSLDFEKEIELPKIIKVLTGRMVIDPNTNEPVRVGGGVNIIGGFQNKCLLKPSDKVKFDKDTCDACYYKTKELCPYTHQYGTYIDEQKRKISLEPFRIYQHANLFQPSVYDYGWTPKLIVIDEDIIQNMTKIFSIKKEQNALIKEIIQLVEIGDSSLESVIQKKKKEIKKQIHLLLNHKKPSELSGWKIELITALKILLAHASYLSGDTDVQPRGSMWIEDGRLYVGWLLEIHEKWKDIPILYLDASGSEEIISRCTGIDFDFHKVRFKYNDNVDVIQVENNSLSKYWIMKKEENLQKLADWVGSMNEDSTGFISYKSIKVEDDTNSTDDSNADNDKPPELIEIPFVESLVSENQLCGWFGKVRGLNEFKDLSQLVVIGRHAIGSEALLRYGKVIYGNDPEPLSNESFLIDKTIRMKDGDHLTLKNWDYADERMRVLSEHFEKSETYQAIHRARLVWGDEYKRVIIVSNIVNDITVSRSIKFESLLKGQLDFEDFIRDVGVWNFSDSDGMSSFSKIPLRTITDLKKEESSMYQVRKYNVREIKSRKKKVGMKFIISSEAFNGNPDDIIRLFEERGYKLLEST